MDATISFHPLPTHAAPAARTMGSPNPDDWQNTTRRRLRNQAFHAQGNTCPTACRASPVPEGGLICSSEATNSGFPLHLHGPCPQTLIRATVASEMTFGARFISTHCSWLS